MRLSVKILVSCIMMITLIFSVSVFSLADSEVSLVINGKKASCDVPPVIVNGRTMVPVRVLFEYYNADVSWDDNLRQAVIKSGSTVMIFNIDSRLMYLNGEAHILDAAPFIKEGRTLVPVRFISEKLNYIVNWNEASRTVSVTKPDEVSSSVTSPKPTEGEAKPPEDNSSDDNNKISVNSIQAKNTGDTYEVLVSLSEKISPKIMKLEDPYRLVFDFYGTKQALKDGNISSDNEYIIETRWAAHDEYTRLVIETAEKADYDISYVSNKNCKISIELPDNTAESKPKPVIPDGKPLVILDAGHGGYDPGAVGRDEDDNIILKEKEVCLDIAKRVQKLLEASGVSVVMTRDKDIALGDTEAEDLTKRAEIANNTDASLFISIHNNAFTSSEPNGTCILYAGLATNTDYGITGKELARNIQDYMLAYTGLYDRGIIERPGIAVLRKTKMPAVLIECAFISNPDDQKVLASNDGREKMTKAIYDGIIKSLKKMGRLD